MLRPLSFLWHQHWPFKKRKGLLCQPRAVRDLDDHFGGTSKYVVISFAFDFAPFPIFTVTSCWTTTHFNSLEARPQLKLLLTHNFRSWYCAVERWSRDHSFPCTFILFLSAISPHTGDRLDMQETDILLPPKAITLGENECPISTSSGGNSNFSCGIRLGPVWKLVYHCYLNGLFLFPLSS